MGFDYDGWLESGYTDRGDGCDETCPVCTRDCRSCEGAGKIQEIVCPTCNGTGYIFDQEDKYEHDEYYNND
jgi:DnaJ-class molecular chaperone